VAGRVAGASTGQIPLVWFRSRVGNDNGLAHRQRPGRACRSLLEQAVLRFDRGRSSHTPEFSPTVRRQDLRAALKKCRPDWDITASEMKAEWPFQQLQGSRDLLPVQPSMMLKARNIIVAVSRKKGTWQ